MNGIFISYRRDDSAFVSGLIHERLAAHFGSDAIFTDIDSIPLGVNFKKYIDEQVGRCDIFLAIIGEKWLSVTDEGDRPRLQQPGDFVRLEIESALKREIPVIPLLVGNIAMPPADELPDSLRELADRNGTPIRPKPTFDSDVERLIRGIEKHLGIQPKAAQEEKQSRAEPTKKKIKPERATSRKPRPKHVTSPMPKADEDKRKAQEEERERAREETERRAEQEKASRQAEKERRRKTEEERKRIGSLESATGDKERRPKLKKAVILTIGSVAAVIVVLVAGGLILEQMNLSELHREAALGNIEAQWSLGVKYSVGMGVPKDPVKGAELYRAAAIQGHVGAQQALGRMYEQGDGVQKSYEQAAQYYRAAAIQGDAPSQSSLGVLYFHGRGVPKDREQATGWLQKAADQGYPTHETYLDGDTSFSYDRIKNR